MKHMINIDKLRHFMNNLFKIIFCIFLFPIGNAHESYIRPPFGNTKVVSTFVKPGDFVQKGQLIARLDTNELKGKLTLLRSDKQEIENEIQLTHKLMKKTKARRTQRVKDKQQAQIEANQIISGLGNLSSMKKKALSNQQIESDIKSLSSSHQKQRHLLQKLNDTLKSLTVSELKLDELIQAAEVKSLYDGMILDLVKVNHNITDKREPLGTIDHV